MAPRMAPLDVDVKSIMLIGSIIDAENDKIHRKYGKQSMQISRTEI